MMEKSDSMRKVLVVTEKDKWHKFDSFYAAGLQVSLAGPDLELTSDSELEKYDLLFLRTKNGPFLHALQEKYNKPLIINSPEASLLVLDRYKTIEMVGSAGVPVPRQYIAGMAVDEDIVVKNRYDFTPNKPALLNADEWLLYQQQTGEAYAQQYIAAQWEYKVYIFGSQCWLYRQVPTMINPDKLATREMLGPDELLFKLARDAADAVGLLFASVDFLLYNETYYMTDINATPGLQNLATGYQEIAHKVEEYIYQNEMGNV